MMRIKVIFLISGFLFVHLSVRAQKSEPVVSVNLKDASFEAFTVLVEEKTGIHFYYRNEWTNDIVVNVERDSINVTDLVREVLRGSQLYFSLIDSDRIYILPDNPLITTIPKQIYSDRDSIATQLGSISIINRTDYLRGKKLERIVRTIVVGKPGIGSRSVARIRGLIWDADSGEPVGGATMVILETGKGSVSDQHGTVTMALPPGKYTAQFSFIGMDQMDVQLNVLSDGEFQIEMKPVVIAIDEVKIMGNYYRDINSTDMGVERLSMKSLKQVPVFMGEKDVIKISRLLPGISSAGEASTGVNVRGGNADQNIFYINHLPVYNTSHLFGFFSAFNSDLINDFTIYKGNVPVNYGGRLSSIFNISTRKGNLKKYKLHAGISPVSAHASVEGPIKKDFASFILSGRSSYSDWILKRMEDPLLRESKAFFYDFAGVVNIQPNEANQVNLFYYQSFDDFKYGDISEYNYANRGGSIIWKHIYSPALSSSFIGAVSGYKFGNVQKYEISSAYQHSYDLKHWGFTSEFSWVPGLNHDVDFGMNLNLYGLDRGELEPYGSYSLKIPLTLGTEKGLEGGLFLSDNISILPWLSVYAGLRYSFYSALGPETVRIYEDGIPKTDNTVKDSITFSNNEIIDFNSGPEIRMAMNIKTGRNTSLKLSFNQMRQYLFMLSNTVTISPTDQWKLSDYHISPPYGYQVSTAFNQIIPGLGLSTSVEIYYKRANDVLDYKGGVDFTASPYTETSVLQGQQSAYGAEFMIQKSSGRIEGWINYTYSRSMMLVEGENELDVINNGKPYPSNYDRPHILNFVGNYHVNRRLTLSSNLVYMSGRPISYPSSLFYIDDIVYVNFDARNQFRVPDYFRIDASVSIEGNLKNKKLFHSSWSLNVYNVLGRRNAQSIYFESGEYFIRGFSFAVIGAPIFTVTWNIRMGNYEGT